MPGSAQPVAPALPAALSDAMPFALTLRTAFRGLRRREGMIISGPRGAGEFAPFDDYPDWAAARWLGSAIEAAFGHWPQQRRTSIACNAIIPDGSVADTVAAVRAAVDLHGCDVLKVKVGGPDGTDHDVTRIRAVVDALDERLGRGRGTVRLDVNAGWDVPTAVAAVRTLGDILGDRLAYVEQPCATVDDLAAVRAQVGVPIAVDELIRRARNPLDEDLVSRVRASADVVILKAAPLGGVDRALAVARAYDLPVVASGSLDSSVGLAAGLALAAALPQSPACGLGTGVLLRTDLVARTLVPTAGRIAVQRPAVDAAALSAAAAEVSTARARWWTQRLHAAWAAAQVEDRARWTAWMSGSAHAP